MNFVIHVQPDATEDVARIYEYYEEQRPGLGDRFQEALNDCYITLGRNPYFQIKKGPFRHLMLRKFPYRVVYEVEGNVVIVNQVSYMGREPHAKFGPKVAHAFTGSKELLQKIQQFKTKAHTKSPRAGGCTG